MEKTHELYLTIISYEEKIVAAVVEALKQIYEIFKSIVEELRKLYKITFDFDSSSFIFNSRVKNSRLKKYYKVPLTSYNPAIRKNEPYMRRIF